MDGTHDVGYDEFAFLHENAAEHDLPFDPASPPAVRRAWVPAPSGHELSALVWGDEPAELVLLHGGAQNAHTWDTVALALDRPLVAIDLPGHGHSDWRGSRDYRPQAMAEDVVAVVGDLAPQATTLVGMSLGGLTALAALSHAPGLAERLVLVDITPGVDAEKAKEIADFVSAAPEVFDSFDQILELTVMFNPTRSESSLRRGIVHNARELPDGRWQWRYDRQGPLDPEARSRLDVRFDDLWDAVGTVPAELVLVRGGVSPVVGDDDVAEVRRRRPGARIEVVDGAGHSIQGDRPVELAALLSEIHTGGAGTDRN